MNRHSQKHHVIPSDLSQLAAIRSEINQQLSLYNYPENTVFAIRLAVDEALCNAIKHGNKQDSTKNITVDYDINDKRFTMTVEDQGEGFTPKDIPDPTADENLTKTSGRGVMLIQLYMTNVKYNTKGNIITISKDKSCIKPA